MSRATKSVVPSQLLVDNNTLPGGGTYTWPGGAASAVDWSPTRSWYTGSRQLIGTFPQVSQWLPGAFGGVLACPERSIPGIGTRKKSTSSGAASGSRNIRHQIRSDHAGASTRADRRWLTADMGCPRVRLLDSA